MKRALSYLRIGNQFVKAGGRRFAVIEGNRGCNRNCPYCEVPKKYDLEKELTVEEAFKVIDWLYNQGFRLVSWLGGEPLASFQTKEGISFLEHTLRIIEYVTKKGMVVGATTNGDYLSREIIRNLKLAGLDSLTLSLHTYSKQEISRLVKWGKLVARSGIIPAIQVVLTTKTTERIPEIAARVTKNGILFSVGVVQEKGGGLSASQKGKSFIPSLKQQKQVFAALLRLKTFGLVRNNRNYLKKAPDLYPNNWKCSPERDAFVHIGAGGTIDVCSDIRTDIKVGDIPRLNNRQWRSIKRAKIANCGNCLFHCYYEAQNPSLLGDIPMLVVMLLIKAGRAGLVERWGRLAVEISKRLE